MCGKEAGRAIVRALHRDEILEQPAHPAVAVERGRLARRIEGVDLAVGQHPRERLVLADALDDDVGRKVELQLLGPAGLLLAARHIGDAVDGHPVMIRENAPDPDRRRHLILGVADPLADQILRLFDARPGAHIDRGVAEEAGPGRPGWPRRVAGP